MRRFDFETRAARVLVAAFTGFLIVSAAGDVRAAAPRKSLKAKLIDYGPYTMFGMGTSLLAMGILGHNFHFAMSGVGAFVSGSFLLAVLKAHRRDQERALAKKSGTLETPQVSKARRTRLPPFLDKVVFRFSKAGRKARKTNIDR